MEIFLHLKEGLGCRITLPPLGNISFSISYPISKNKMEMGPFLCLRQGPLGHRNNGIFPIPPLKANHKSLDWFCISEFVLQATGKYILQSNHRGFLIARWILQVLLIFPSLPGCFCLSVSSQKGLRKQAQRIPQGAGSSRVAILSSPGILTDLQNT